MGTTDILVEEESTKTSEYEHDQQYWQTETGDVRRTREIWDNKLRQVKIHVYFSDYIWSTQHLIAKGFYELHFLRILG